MFIHCLPHLTVCILKYIFKAIYNRIHIYNLIFKTWLLSSHKRKTIFYLWNQYFLRNQECFAGTTSLYRKCTELWPRCSGAGWTRAFGKPSTSNTVSATCNKWKCHCSGRMNCSHTCILMNLFIFVWNNQSNTS